MYLLRLVALGKSLSMFFYTLSGKHSVSWEPMIRTITSCRITRLNMLFLPLRFQSTYLVKLSRLVLGIQDYNQQRPSQELVAKDLHDTEWKFRHIYRGSTTAEQTHSWFYLGSIATYLDMSLCTWYIPTPAHSIHFLVLSWCHGWTSYSFESLHLGFWVIIHPHSSCLKIHE